MVYFLRKVFYRRGRVGRDDQITPHITVGWRTVPSVNFLNFFFFVCVYSGFITILTQQTSHFDLPLDIVVTYEDTVHIVAN